MGGELATGRFRPTGRQEGPPGAVAGKAGMWGPWRGTGEEQALQAWETLGSRPEQPLGQSPRLSAS